MKLLFSIVFIIFSFQKSIAQLNARVERNLTAFCKLYGYIRFFHPSDEAQKIDWAKFAVYGSKKMITIKNDQELINELRKLFLPIAPTAKVDFPNKNLSFSLKQITPKRLENYKVVSWQHLGIELPETNSPYKSIRLNRKSKSASETDPQFIPLFKSLSTDKYIGKKFIFRVILRGDTSSNNYDLRISASSNFQNRDSLLFYSLNKTSLIDRQKKVYKFSGLIPLGAKSIILGVTFNSESPLSIDSSQVFIQDQGRLIKLESDGTSLNTPYSTDTLAKYSLDIKNYNQYQHPLFPEQVRIGEYIKTQLVPGISCLVPIALYGNEVSTYPGADVNQLKKLSTVLSQNVPNQIAGKSRGSLLEFRLGDIIIVWNVLKHFFPYWHDTSKSPEAIFRDAIVKAYANKDAYDFYYTLKLMGAALNDGHVFTGFYGDSINDAASTPLVLTKAENKVLIKYVLDSTLKSIIKSGDIIDSIDHRTSGDALLLKEKYLSGSPQWKQQKALFTLTNGEANSFQNYTIKHDEKILSVSVKRSLPGIEYREGSFKPKPVRSGQLKSDLFYFNLSDDSIMVKIEDMGDQLINAKSIIFDLRGHPKGYINSLISHLSQRSITTNQFHTPEVIYPDYKKVNFKTSGWSITPEAKHYNGKIYFLTDGSAMSYSESFLGVIKDFKLGTIIGQQTAGTNGNINYVPLLGGYQISFSGMLVTNNDGSKHHLKGIIPDILAEPTIEGIRQGKDEILEKAISVAEGN